MRMRPASRRRAVLFGASCAALMAASSAFAANQQVTQTNLVTDDQAFLASQGYTPAATEDRDLINPWGLSFGPTSPFWISDQGSGLATLYDGLGGKRALVVTIPGSAGGPTGPTGQVFNPTTDFVLSNGAKANFIFANLNGTISGWNGAAGTTALVEANPGGAIYTGLAMGSSGGANFLYAANDLAGTVDVFDAAFNKTTLAGSFTDPNLPAGLVPFNVANIGGKLYVMYAPPGPEADEAAVGTGVVNIFNTDGTFDRRFATGGTLGATWGIVKAPDSFGAFGGAILIGNFSDEDGFISAFRESDGAFLGRILEPGSDDPIELPDLWSLSFGNGGTGFDPNALYFTAGIGDELHGLFGRLNAVPEPSSWALMVAGFGLVGWGARRRPAQPLPG
jgi:uncharacterized protein (TIGR03118 family)